MADMKDSLLVLKTLGWSGDPQIEASQPHVEVMPVELFTNPNRSPIVISTITDHSKLQIIKVGNNWVRCRYLGGVPVWVHGDLLEVKQNVATIIGRNVNARSHPRIADNTVVGKFRSGDQRPVLQRDGEWYRIIGLPDFLVWMKKAEYQEVFAESKKKNLTPEQVSTVVARSVFPALWQPEVPIQKGFSDDSWLFAQPDKHTTIVLGSFADSGNLNTFFSALEQRQQRLVRRFISGSNDVHWCYLLLGSYANAENAKKRLADLSVDGAHIVFFSDIKRGRCQAWKKKIPTPASLNKYCRSLG